MTSPVASARPKTARTLAALAATAIVGALSPVALAAPAVAAPADAACPEGFGATAASNTLALGRVDLRATGLSGVVLPELRVATTHSGIAGGTLRAAADARYLRSSGDLPAGVLGPRAYQQAPPSNDQPDVVNVAGVDLGALRLGTGGLRAQASWKNAGRCTTADGPRAASSATLAGITVLPGRNGRALLRINAVESATVTGVGSAGGRPAATAAATGGIADFKLLDNGPSAIGVRVISPPTLHVLAGAKKTVDYTAPVLEITIPGQAPVRVSSAGSHVDVVVPVDAASTEAAADLARTESLPLLGGLSLIDLLTGITSAVSGTVGGAVSGADAVVPGLDLPGLLGSLPGLPAVGGLLGGGGAPSSAATESSSTQGSSRVVVLRVELGSVEKQFSSTGVYAKAASVRVKLISRNTWKSSGGYGHGGSGPADQTSLIDLGICTLETAAAAPKAPAGSTTAPGDDDSDDDSDGGYGPGDDDDDDGYGHHGGGGTGGTGGGNTSGGGLPVTGNNVALMLGGGVLLVVGGRLLQILARRRAA
ncbi:hypothetical protein ACFO1B_47010 [Dactylosporangium siamense]|uniref:Gram-positive cocci surface proteins LPxTG domain-containing protein n=1 Tax=Dactylosporangium siamense TaxID=685454 RepID=A0A919PXM0_9ACTN|nr:hypothetical protein [Dactylosporangium siamense]GIG50513.1 hypothetical protein Dsi01nite_085540 [Dactylosporangium siamense]